MLTSTLLQVDPYVTISYMVLGYAVMWVVALIYVISLAVRQNNLKRDITLMRRLLEESE